MGGVIYFALNNALSATSAFLPTIITTFGFSTSSVLIIALTHSLRIYVSTANARAQLLTVPPYVVAAVVMLSLSYASDKLQSRGIFLCFGCSLSGIGYLYVCSSDLLRFFSDPYFCDFRLLLTVANNIHVRYFATFCVVSGTYTSIGLTIAWCKSPHFRLMC